jgi:hypothetical protein
MSDPLSTLRLTLKSHLALLEEMRDRRSRMRANRFQALVAETEARRLREKNPQMPDHSEEEGK